MITFVDAVKAFDISDNPAINLGTFTVGGDLRSGRGSASTAGAADPQEQLESKPTIPKTKEVTKNFGTTKGSFQFPVISEPLTAFNLLLGKPVDLFLYDLPGLSLDFRYVQSFPIFPGLNARLGGQVSADTNFSFGFNTAGVQRGLTADIARPMWGPSLTASSSTIT